MARKPRFNLPGFPQHVIQRGNNREACFYTSSDYRQFLHLLAEAATHCACVVHAYVLMTNHVHLLVTPNVKHGLSRMMQRVGASYVRYINHTYQRTGTLWEGRYKSGLVGTDRYLLVCHRYIELNPVRAAMVRLPEHYQYSSYRANALGMANPLLTPHPVYAGLGATPEARCHAYRSLFRNALAEEDVSDIRMSLNQEMIYGNDRFKAQVEAMIHRPVRPGKAGRPRQEDGKLQY